MSNILTVKNNFRSGTSSAFQTGRDLWELNHGATRVGNFVTNPNVTNAAAAFALAGAASQVVEAYYNPFAAAVVAAPIVYEGAKWLWDQI